MKMGEENKAVHDQTMITISYDSLILSFSFF